MPQQRSNQQRIRILFVDDHGLLREQFYEAFNNPHVVHTASTAEEGWNLYLDKNPQIIFLDIGLPDASGHDLARRIKNENPSAYIVMATASRYSEDSQEARNNDVDGYIIKPFDIKKIASHIERYRTNHLSGL